MRQSLRYASWLLLLFILLSCSHRVTGEATALPPILQAEAQSQKYNLQLDFMKHHFSGMLIVRQMPDNEIRILGSTYFGLSLLTSPALRHLHSEQLHGTDEEEKDAENTGN